MLLPFSIFLVTLILIITQPRGFQIGTIAISGAIVAFLFGVVNFNDVVDVFDIIWDATLAFIGIIIFSMILDKIGFFEYCALKMAKLSGGSGRKMFFYSIILGALVSALFANDGAALILTPILLAKMNILRLNTKTILAFLLAGGFISDSASLPFVFSNLTNIVTANYFNIGFGTFFANMIFPFFISTLISMLILWIVLRKDIPLHVDITLLKNPKDAIKHKGLFNFSWFFIALLLCSYFIGDAYHLPISLFALGGALIFLLIAAFARAIKPKEIIKDAPWQVVWFSLGLYIVVYGLKNAGLTDYLSEVLLYLNTQSQLVAVVGTGFLAAILSAVMNNMPTIMIMDIALKDIGNDAMIYANIIGCNLGTKMTPFGSLATLLWLHTLEKKGIKINYYSYTKFGLLVTPIVLLVVLLSLL
ncbi:MAG TPA: arsenic transporter [Sulfurimonas sp.]|uniref:arsenic transporter n=1 Tax=Sulfurimonas sp. TaxID=2022749 RepID=UPI002CF3AA4A|nr:arsenic transporter [Sulfurimonas sp.]HUH42371.1 arsenic transporter [Sulfurimonas sp.]